MSLCSTVIGCGHLSVRNLHFDFGVEQAWSAAARVTSSLALLVLLFVLFVMRRLHRAFSGTPSPLRPFFLVFFYGSVRTCFLGAIAFVFSRPVAYVSVDDFAFLFVPWKPDVFPGCGVVCLRVSFTVRLPFRVPLPRRRAPLGRPDVLSQTRLSVSSRPLCPR